MRVAGKLTVAARDIAGVHEQVGTVGEGVFNRVMVKVLINVVAAVVPPGHAYGAYRPRSKLVHAQRK
jgi:hypothetical protein